MAKKFIMAVGLNYAVKDTTDKALPSVEEVFHCLRSSLSVSKIARDKAALTFDHYNEVEELIKDIFEYSSTAMNCLTEDKKLCFDIIIMEKESDLDVMFAKAVDIVNNLMRKRREQASLYLVQVYITKRVYEKLSPRYRDLYHSAVEVEDTVVHQRFSEDAQRCFVVSPIGGENTEIRKRADLVFERYIKPACETTPFRPVRGEMMLGNFISQEITDALQTDPMVIVYLGSPKPGWNPNVMFELGARTASGAPYVIIKDSTSEGKPYELPFDIKDDRTVDIPEIEEDNLELGAIKIRTIRDRILASVQEYQWDAIYPSATVDIKIGEKEEGVSKFTDASKSLEILFEYKGIAGRDVLSIIQHLTEKMPSVQRNPFITEQNDIVGRLAVQNVFGISNIHATVPLVFKKHQKYQGRAFLPMIVRYRFTKLTSVLRLRILYIDVTSATRFDPNRGCYVCSLTGNGRLDLSELNSP